MSLHRSFNILHSFIALHRNQRLMPIGSVATLQVQVTLGHTPKLLKNGLIVAKIGQGVVIKQNGRLDAYFTITGVLSKEFI